MTLTHLAHRSDRAWAFQEQRLRHTLAQPLTRSACVEPLTEAQIDARYWSAAKASHMRAAAFRQSSKEEVRHASGQGKPAHSFPRQHGPAKNRAYPNWDQQQQTLPLRQERIAEVMRGSFTDQRRRGKDK